MAAGVHPASPFGETRRVQSQRYDAISAEFAGLLRTPTSALQVHVGMPDADTAITVYRGLRNRLAVFRALGAASPFWHGRDSGLASARSAILRSYPRCTMPPVLRSYEEYEWRMRQVVASAQAPDYTYVWWDLRPHPRLGTLELRVMDARASVDQCVALTALAQGMARHAADEPMSVDLPVEVLQENDFRAYRYGLDARVLDIDGYVKPLRQLAYEALEDARDALRADGLDQPLDLVAAMLREPLECHASAGSTQRAGCPPSLPTSSSRTWPRGADQMYADELLEPWLDALTADLPPMPLVDAHTHIGQHDPSGFEVELEQLTSSLELIDGRAVVFPLREPQGYRQANLTCADAAASSDGRLTAFVRLTPDEDPDKLLEEGLAAGARGVKLHPASDEFAIDDPRLDGVHAVCDQLNLPVVVHAGPELEGIGDTALTLCHRHPGLRVVLAHCALTDLGWIWCHVPETPNLFFDTSWWGPSHLMALLGLVPPGRILNASDLPYCSPLSSAFTTLRCGIQAGLEPHQLASVLGGQCLRLLDREEPLDLGPPPAHRHHPGLLLERLSSTLIAVMEPLQRGESPGTLLDVARHGCKIPDDHPDAPVVASVARLIELYDAHHESLPQTNQFTPGWDLLAAAAVVARTPAAPLPD